MASNNEQPIIASQVEEKNQIEKKNQLQASWAVAQKQLPKPWTLPLMMTAIGIMRFVSLIDRKHMLFKYQNMECSFEIRIEIPDWLRKNFGDMIQSFHDEALQLITYRYHAGGRNGLNMQDWQDQWFEISCYPHFSLMPCTDHSQDDGDESYGDENKKQDNQIAYYRIAFIKDYGIQPIAKRICKDLPSQSFPACPPMINFFGVVNTSRFVLADNSQIGLDEVTRNSSAIFLTWSKFPSLEKGSKPEPGWYANYVYAMLPKTKPHLAEKCKAYKRDTTPFRKDGRKAFVRGYMHGFCNKKNIFTTDTKHSNLDYIPFIEIIEIDWVFTTEMQPPSQEVPKTPSKPIVKPETTSAKSKRKFTFNPFDDVGVGSSRSFEEKLRETKSDNKNQTSEHFDGMEEHHEPINMIELGQAIVETEDEIVDDTNSSPTKKIKVGSRNKSAMQAK